MGNSVEINRKKYSSEKFVDLEWANILQQDWRSLMIRTLDLGKIRFDTVEDLRNCYCAGGIKFEQDLDARRVLDKLNRPGLISLDAGIAYYLCNNADMIPESWDGKIILFPGTIFCHKPYGRFWEPYSMLSMYQMKFDDGTKKWTYTYENLHVLSQYQIFAYLAEDDRDKSDIINTSVIYDVEPGN